MNNATQQRGIALLVSLLLLLMLTIIAISAANQSTLLQRMAGNSQQQNIAFQASESGLEAWVNDYDQNVYPQIRAHTLAAVPPWSTQGVGKASYAVSAALPNNCYGVMPSYSLNAGENASTFKYACYDIRSTGKGCIDSACADADNPAQATHIMGYLVRY